MPFELEVVEAALLSRIQRLEQRLIDLEPHVEGLLEVLPNRLTGDILEQLRTSKQTLVLSLFFFFFSLQWHLEYSNCLIPSYLNW